MAPSAMRPDGTCPTCGTDVETPAMRSQVAEGDERAPWHFKLLVVMTVIYLVWRFFQLLT
jgi:hypothetical protein